jgi:predicted Fe-Mo cluster-binding NifX family protein
LEDVVSEVFGKAKTFTIVDVEDGEVEKMQVVDNPAASYEYGAGPVAAKKLADLKVNSVISAHFGPGALSLLEHYKMRHFLIEPNMKVKDSIRETLSKLTNTKARSPRDIR